MSIRPRIVSARPSGVTPASSTSGTASRTSSIRFQDAMPRWRMLVTQPNAIIGQDSMTRYALKATKSPSVMRPLITSRLPSQSTSSDPNPRKSVMLG